MATHNFGERERLEIDAMAAGVEVIQASPQSSTLSDPSVDDSPSRKDVARRSGNNLDDAVYRLSH